MIEYLADWQIPKHLMVSRKFSMSDEGCPESEKVFNVRNYNFSEDKEKNVIWQILHFLQNASFLKKEDG